MGRPLHTIPDLANAIPRLDGQPDGFSEVNWNGELPSWTGDAMLIDVFDEGGRARRVWVPLSAARLGPPRLYLADWLVKLKLRRDRGGL